MKCHQFPQNGVAAAAALWWRSYVGYFSISPLGNFYDQRNGEAWDPHFVIITQSAMLLFFTLFEGTWGSSIFGEAFFFMVILATGTKESYCTVGFCMAKLFIMIPK